MLVCALACLVLVIYTGLTLVEILEIFDSAVEESEMIDGDDFLMLTILLSYIMTIAIDMSQAVLFIVFGIKLIVKTAKGVHLDKYKNMAITMQVICYVFAGLSIGGDYITSGAIFALSLTAGILLSCALSQNKKEKELALTSSYGSYKDDTGNIQMENIPNGESKAKPFNEKMYAEELSSKIASVKALKDSGVIDENEYSKMVHKILGIEENVEEKNVTSRKKKKDDENEG